MSKDDEHCGGFVPLGDMAGAVDLSPATPQARHHFTRLDQIDQLVGASEAEPDIGFMARLLALCSLPRTNPGDRKEYVRRNGPYTLIMSAGGHPARLPYGILPRLLLAWVCSEAVRTQRRQLVLGRSLYEFMRKLGMENRSGGINGERTCLKNQMRRLFRCSVQLVYVEAQHEVIVQSFIADRAEFWWDATRDSGPSLWDSTIELGEKFFHEIIAHPVPIDLHILKAIKRSPLGLDLYLWLTYRTFNLKTPLCLSWRQLYRQFGADPARVTAGRVFDASRVRVIDGDTIEVEGTTATVRLMGIDTPETKHPTRPVEYYGAEAAALAETVLSGMTVDLTTDRTGDREDVYGRWLRYVVVRGVDFNAALVRGGYARAVRGFAYARRAEFIGLENEARSRGVGLWEARGPE